MCCLPNKFPLPIVLLINKCDLIEESKRREWIEKLNIDNYYTENQFFAKFYLSNNDEMNNQKIVLKNEVEGEEKKDDEIYMDMKIPFMKIINFVLEFGDIKSLFIENGLNSNKKDNDSKKKKDKEGGCTII